MISTAQGAATPAGRASRIPQGWSDRARRLALDVRLLAQDHVELAVLEAQRAGQALVRTLVAAVSISVLVSTAWLGVVAAFVVWLTDAGMAWPVALLIGAAACVVTAALIGWWVKRNAEELMFSATLQQLRATKSAVEDEL